MPKSKVRKKSDRPQVTVKASSGESLSAARTERALRPSPAWYPIVATVLMVLGLAWMVVYYLAGQDVPVMDFLSYWNFAVAFGLMMLGLVMLVRWR